MPCGESVCDAQRATNDAARIPPICDYIIIDNVSTVVRTHDAYTGLPMSILM